MTTVVTSFAVQDFRFEGQSTDGSTSTTASAVWVPANIARIPTVNTIAGLNPGLPSRRHEFINLFVRVVALTMPGIAAIISIAKTTRFSNLLIIFHTLPFLEFRYII